MALGASIVSSVPRPFTVNAQPDAGGTPSGELEASASTVDIGQPVKLTATNLRNVGSHVQFRLRGSLSFEPDCSDLRARTITPPLPETVSYMASVTVYGCAPGGPSTATVETTESVFIDDVQIHVNRPVTLTATESTIDIGASTQVNARNLPLDVGTSVRFGLLGPLDFDRGCTSRTSNRSVTTSRSTTVVLTATTTIYGCAPGGTGTVILRTTAGRELKRTQIEVNPPPPVLTASRNPVYIGQSTKLTATGLPADVGPSVTFRYVGFLHHNRNCASQTSAPAQHRVTRTPTYTARTTVYGCPPGGDTTVYLETSDGRSLASLEISVLPPPITVPSSPINIGDSAKIAASNLFNVGNTVIFALTGPLHFNQDCGGSQSTLRTSIDGNSSVYSRIARTKIYGCSPGGSGTVTLKKKDGTILNSAAVTVNPSSGSIPTGEITASLETVGIGQSFTLTVSNLNTHGATPELKVDGPIHADQYCGLSTETTAAITGTIANNSEHTYYGCVPGGSAIVSLVAGDFTLDTVTVKVSEPPEYAPMIQRPGSGTYCRFPFTNPILTASSATSVRSPGGYSHIATAEIWAGSYRVPELSNRCVEARFTNESTPGGSLSTWSGIKYETQRRLRLVPEINLENLLQGEYDAVLDLFYEPEPISEGEIVSPEVSTTCERCKGGTLQTVQHVVAGKIIKHSKIHVRGQHTFNVDNWSQTVDSSTSWKVTTHLIIDPPSAGIEQIRSEVADLLFGHVADLVDRFLNWIWENVRP